MILILIIIVKFFKKIKNTKKINKWSNKAKKMLVNLPSEMFEDLVKKHYN